jgi:hypothetical protein
MCIYTHVRNTETLVWQRKKDTAVNATCQGNLSVCHRFASPDVAYSVGTGGSFPRVKGAGHEADHSTSTLCEVMKLYFHSAICHDMHRDISPKHDLFQAALLLNNASCGSKFVNNDSTNTPFSYIYVSYPSNGFCTQAWLNRIREIDFHTILPTWLAFQKNGILNVFVFHVDLSSVVSRQVNRNLHIHWPVQNIGQKFTWLWCFGSSRKLF